MSYQKHTWVSKEIITSKNLNHLEDGVYQEEQRALLAEDGLNRSVDDEILRATGAEQALATRVGTTENSITTLNGNDQVEGSVDYKIAQATAEMGGYKVVLDHTQVSNPSDKYIYLEPDSTATGSDKFRQWIYYYNETEQQYEWHMTDDISLDLSDYIQKTDYATTSTAGIVKPDGTTVTITADGTLSAASQATGVITFNGRSGTVTPQQNDYAYSQLSGLPTLGTASALNVASQGNAGNNEVVKGDDTRLSDARTPTSHTHTTSEISDFPSIPGGVKSGTSVAGATDTTLYFIRS